MTSTATVQKLNTAVRHHQSGDMSQALQLYADVLRTEPDNADAWHLSGLAAWQSGDPAQAESLILHALELKPRAPEFKANLAAILVNQHRDTEAEKICREVLRIDAKHAGALSHLGTALRQQQRFSEALDAYQSAVQQQRSPESLCNLGAVLIELGQYQEATEVLRESVALNPAQGQTLINLGSAYRRLGDADAALEAFAEAEELTPNAVELHISRGNLLHDNGLVLESIESFQRAIALDSSRPSAVGGLGRALQQIGYWEQSLEAHRLAAELDPDDPFFQSSFLYHTTLNPVLSQQDAVQCHLDWGRRIEAVTPTMPHRNDRTADRPLRIGYVSPDFRAHATMRFLEPLLQHHDRGAFPLYFYSESGHEDAVTERIGPYGAGWCRTRGMSDTELAQRIQVDQIDILVDLAGHTGENRLPMFAHKPAPVQATFLGYPNTTGLSRIDYLLTDEIRTPPTASARYSEQPVLLPHGGFCYQPAIEADVAAAPCLQNGFVTFGSTHRLEKLSTESLSVWAAVLSAVPNSKLLIFRDVLKSRSLQNQTLVSLEAAGVPVERVQFGWQLPEPYVDVYSQIDVLLDVLPWGAGTIACDSMYMGVPIPTIATPGTRCGGAAVLLHYSGFPELIAGSRDEYLKIVADLARNTARLTTLRRRIRPAMQSTVCNAPQFAQDVESAYRRMWHTWLQTSTDHKEAQ